MLLNKKVIGISGAMHPEREGIITKWVNEDIGGAMYYVKWEGQEREEPYFPHQFKPYERGAAAIGVYYIN